VSSTQIKYDSMLIAVLHCLFWM